MKDPGFGKRLEAICEKRSGIVPEVGQGRYVAIARACGVTYQAVERWFNGGSRPRSVTMAALARYLDCDEAELSLGIVSALTQTARARFNRATQGVQHLAMGLAMLDGGHCAVPDEPDPRKEFVDFYMIYEGRNVPVRASFGLEQTPGEFTFNVPREFIEVRNVGFVRTTNSRSLLHMLDLQPNILTRHVRKEGSGFSLLVKKVKTDNYMSGRDSWPLMSSFTELAR